MSQFNVLTKSTDPEKKKINIFLFIKKQTETKPTFPSVQVDCTASCRRTVTALLAGPDLTVLH